MEDLKTSKFCLMALSLSLGIVKSTYNVSGTLFVAILSSLSCYLDSVPLPISLFLNSQWMIFHIISALEVRSVKLFSFGGFHAYGLLTTFLIWFPASVNIFVKRIPSCSGASIVGEC